MGWGSQRLHGFGGGHERGTWKEIQKQPLEMRGEAGKCSVIGVKGGKNVEKESVCSPFCYREAQETGAEGTG